jgi:hypothetical protein
LQPLSPVDIILRGSRKQKFFLTILCIAFQDKTGPTFPLTGRFETPKGEVKFKFLRSENIGSDLTVMLFDPVPDGVGGHVRYRRFKSEDDWKELPLKRGDFTFSRRGREETVKGVGAKLPSLQERAGKYEFFVHVGEEGKEKSVTGEKPIFARYKGKVPMSVLLAHIIVIFASMTLAIRTALEALADGKFKWMIWATVGSLVLGAFVLGPLVQKYAFGVWWSGFPFGYDLTDNKVLLELLFWVPAVILNYGERRNRASVYLGGIITVAIYFIPHSLFGSEFDYRTGTGHGTAG